MPQRVMMVIDLDENTWHSVQGNLRTDVVTRRFVEGAETLICPACRGAVRAVPKTVRCPHPTCTNPELLE